MNPTSLEQILWLFEHYLVQLTLSSVVNHDLLLKQGLEMDRCQKKTKKKDQKYGSVANYI